MKQLLAFLIAAGAAGAGLYATLKGSGGSLSGARGRPRRTSLRGEAEARELHLFCENDGDIYRQRIEPIRKNLVRKLKKGVYDHTKAQKLWMYAVEDCAKKYAKNFGSEFVSDRPGVPWHKMFSMVDRRDVAKQFADNFKQEFDIDNRDRPRSFP